MGGPERAPHTPFWRSEDRGEAAALLCSLAAPDFSGAALFWSVDRWADSPFPHLAGMI
jgi:hypothetical protein